MKGLIFAMKRAKRWGIIICIISLIATVIGCDIVKVDEEKDRKRVVAKVDGTEVLKGEFLDVYNQSKMMYGITDETEKDPELKDTVKQLKKMVLDHLIVETIIQNKALEAGFNVDNQAIEETKEKIMTEIAESYMEQEGISEDEAKESAQEELEQYMQMSGMTEEEFWEVFTEQEQIAKFRDEMLGDIKVTEGEIESFYNEELEKQKSDPDMALNSNINLYIPEGYRRVKHILIGISQEDREEYMDLVMNEEKDKAERLLEKALKGIEPKARDILERAKNGENFEVLIDEYSKDPGMDREDGYIMGEETEFVESFKDAALKLKQEGDISELVESEYGYHIIKLYDLAGKEFTLDDKRDSIESLVEGEKKNQEWASIIDKWQEESDIKRYERKL
ncbi:MAG: hypothetical protein GX974_00160 [Clostridiales bacterium]|nr:hypothetical protein [Clostridiales bacterium]